MSRIGLSECVALLIHNTLPQKSDLSWTTHTPPIFRRWVLMCKNGLWSRKVQPDFPPLVNALKFLFVGSVVGQGYFLYTVQTAKKAEKVPPITKPESQ